MNVSHRAYRGLGSLDAESYCYRLASQSRFTEALAAADQHNRMGGVSPLRISKFVLGKWAEYAKECG